MLTIVLALLVATVPVVLIAAASVRDKRLALRKRVLVNLVDGKAIDGVLWARRGGYVVLKDATLLVENAQPTTMQGEVLVERDRVDFVQIVGG